MRARWFVLIVALAVLAVACNGDGDGVEGEGAAAGDASACEPDQVDGDLILYNWSEYIDPDLLTAFSEEYDVSVTEDFYPSNEELLARVQGGASGYDVIVPSDYMVGIMEQEGVIMPLNYDAIANAGNIDEGFVNPPFDEDSSHHVPYQWGTTGLGVDTEVLGTDIPHTWGLVFDPALSEEYAGRISLLDDPRETMGGALKYLGYDMNTTNEEELQEASDLIADSRERLAAFESNQYDDLLIQGETVVAHGYSGTFFAAFSEQEDPERYEYFVPEEGGTVWVDTMAILADAPHPCTAHTFINFMLDAENGAALSNWTLYASPNAAAEEFIDEEILSDPAIYPPEEVLDDLTFLEDTGDTEILYNDLFTQAKS